MRCMNETYSYLTMKKAPLITHRSLQNFLISASFPSPDSAKSSSISRDHRHRRTSPVEQSTFARPTATEEPPTSNPSLARRSALSDRRSHKSVRIENSLYPFQVVHRNWRKCPSEIIDRWDHRCGVQSQLGYHRRLVTGHHQQFLAMLCRRLPVLQGYQQPHRSNRWQSSDRRPFRGSEFGSRRREDSTLKRKVTI